MNKSYSNKYYINNTATAVLLMCLVLCLFNCSSTKKDQSENLTCIKLKFNIPIVKLNGELLNLNDSLYVFFSDKIVLYKVAFRNDPRDLMSIQNQKTQYSYFIYEENARYGYNFQSLNDSNGVKIAVDSFLSEKAFNRFIGYNFYDKLNDSLIKTITDKDNATIVKIYVPIKTYNESYSDTTYLYFTNTLENINYSLSNELDSSMQLKLFKVRLAYKKKFSDIYKIELPHRAFLFEIQRQEVDNSKEINNFIKHSLRMNN